MELLFVGTGAADYQAALQCPCPNCREARTLGGRNVRTHASLLVGGDLLIDCGPTVAWRLAELDVDPSRLAAVLVTHAHGDHLDPGALAALVAAHRGAEPLAIYGNAATAAVIARAGLVVAMHEVAAGDWFDVCGGRVLALPATHDWANQASLNYVVERADTTILYATDTAWPGDEWWRLIEPVHVTLAIIEATFGPLGPEGHPDCLTHHLNWHECSRLGRALRRAGRLSQYQPVYATHLSQHFVPIHDHSSLGADGRHAELAYDGLRLTVSPGRPRGGHRRGHGRRGHRRHHKH